MINIRNTPVAMVTLCSSPLFAADDNGRDGSSSSSSVSEIIIRIMNITKFMMKNNLHLQYTQIMQHKLGA